MDDLLEWLDSEEAASSSVQAPLPVPEPIVIARSAEAVVAEQLKTRQRRTLVEICRSQVLPPAGPSEVGVPNVPPAAVASDPKSGSVESCTALVLRDTGGGAVVPYVQSNAAMLPSDRNQAWQELATVVVRTPAPDVSCHEDVEEDIE